MEEYRTPLIALRGQVFFPGNIVGFDIGRDKSLLAIDTAMNGDKYLVVVTQKDTSVNDPDEADCYKTGVLLRLKQVVKRHEEYIRVLADCEQRVRLTGFYDEGNMLACTYEIAQDTDNNIEEIEMQALIRVLKQMYLKYVEMSNSGEAAARALIDGVDDPSQLCNTIAGEVEIDFELKQTLLEIDSVQLRIEQLIEMISKENQILAVAKKINNRVVKNMNRGQKEYYLREQLQVIKEELGEDEDPDEEVRQWIAKLDELKLPEKVDAKMRKEIERFSKMHSMSPDANVSRTYIDTVLSLPWHESSKVSTSIKKAEKILDEEHYGLKNVKERIIESLAVMQLTHGTKAPILCLVGPPGVGKTSIAKSIAHATNREFVRMSLGGVTDEAEIRGHRRTYVGAIPGRVINGIIESGTNNPLFLFDEVDKIGSDFRGDPASALLEVLDPEQNSTFTDRYLEIPFDLSNVMFITTANTTSTIPTPLLDRMEVIELSSYIEDEKVNIAQNYLIPKQLKEHSIRASQLVFNEEAIREIINYYTREAGVRNLEREIANVCRKIAKRLVTEKKKPYRIMPRNLEKYLGKRKFSEDMADLAPAVGTTTGMAWTSVGGVTLEIETVKMPGTGKLILTGQMGDVMKESATTALGYIRSIAKEHGIADEYFKDYDIQIHIPEGATPKDGPSAGVTMFCALYSCLSEKKARRNIAMTGEITLRGRVLKIGGLKEKALAAYSQGITRILIPRENEPDINDIPVQLSKKIEFVLIDTVEDALKEIIIDEDK